MKTSIALLCLLVLLPVLANSQGPGYMGKKTIVGYGGHFNPVTFGATANNKTLFGNDNGSAKTGYFRLNFSQELFLERALSKSWLLGASVKYLRTGYDNRAVLNSQLQRPNDYYEINAFTYTLYFKKYGRQYTAPWGRYFMMGPCISVMRSKHDEYMHILQTVNNHDTLITDFGSDSQKHYRVDLLVGTGMNRVLFNRVTLDFGFNFQVIALLYTIETVLPLYSSTYPKQEEYISETIKSRVRGANRFNVFIKVGYLF